MVLAEFKDTACTSELDGALELNDLFDQINFLSRPLYKLFNENDYKTIKYRFLLASELSSDKEQTKCFEYVLKAAKLSFDKLQELRAIMDKIFPLWNEFGIKHDKLYSSYFHSQSGKTENKTKDETEEEGELLGNKGGTPTKPLSPPEGLSFRTKVVLIITFSIVGILGIGIVIACIAKRKSSGH